MWLHAKPRFRVVLAEMCLICHNKFRITVTNIVPSAVLTAPFDAIILVLDIAALSVRPHSNFCADIPQQHTTDAPAG